MTGEVISLLKYPFIWVLPPAYSSASSSPKVGLCLTVLPRFWGLASTRRVGGTVPIDARDADLTAFTTSKVFLFRFFATA